MRKFLIVTAFALATPAMAHDCPDKVIAAADHLGLNRVESFGATHPTYYLPASLDGSGLLVIDCIEATEVTMTAARSASRRPKSCSIAFAIKARDLRAARAARSGSCRRHSSASQTTSRSERRENASKKKSPAEEARRGACVARTVAGRRWATSPLNLGAAYSHLTTDQLRRMLDAARADYQRQIKETMLKWGVEVTALRKALTQRQAQLKSEIQTLKNNNAVLQRELDLAYDELAKANAVITEQRRKLSGHDAVVELEQRLQAARARMAS